MATAYLRLFILTRRL